MAPQNFMKLGQALASEFTVYIPDRRGRGLSGPRPELWHRSRNVVSPKIKTVSSTTNFNYRIICRMSIQLAPSRQAEERSRGINSYSGTR